MTKPKSTPKVFCFNNEYYTVNEWSKITNISEGALNSRIERNLPVIKIFNPSKYTPIEVSNIRTNEKYIFNSPVEYSIKNNTKLSLVYKALNTSEALDEHRIQYLLQ